MSSKPSCLMVLSAAAGGVSAQSFHHSFMLCSTVFNLQIATPGGKPIEFVELDENNIRWINDFRMKPYANPAKLESIDGARYNAILIPNCPGAMLDLATSGYLAKILQNFCAEKKPICVVGHGVAALCCATSQEKTWTFQGYSMTGPSVFELVRRKDFASLPVIVEDFVKDSRATFSASEPDAVHVVVDRHLITGQNDQSTLIAVQNLILFCNVRIARHHNPKLHSSQMSKEMPGAAPGNDCTLIYDLLRTSGLAGKQESHISPFSSNG